MQIRDIFIQLTKETTVPYHENSLIKFLQQLLPTSYLDSYNNLHCIIGEAKTLFVSHLDNYTTSVKKVNHVFENNFIKTDKTSVLGADDKAGVCVLLQMIFEKIPGHYIFFRAEEEGCIGSLEYKKFYYKQINYSHCVAFDRFGYNDIVICQNEINTASTNFATSLAINLKKTSKNFLNLKAANGGMTDSGVFKYVISECVNISCGYFYNHTLNEQQDIKFLQILSDAVCKIDWQNLSTFRKIPDLRQIIKEESLMNERKLQEIQQIESELGFSL